MQSWLVVISALVAATAVHAQTSAQIAQLEARFAAADTDHDGKLTKQEAVAGMPRVAARFDEIDAQHAGFVTLRQIEDYLLKLKR